MECVGSPLVQPSRVPEPTDLPISIAIPLSSNSHGPITPPPHPLQKNSRTFLSRKVLPLSRSRLSHFSVIFPNKTGFHFAPSEKFVSVISTGMRRGTQSHCLRLTSAVCRVSATGPWVKCGWTERKRSTVLKTLHINLSGSDREPALSLPPFVVLGIGPETFSKRALHC